MSVYFSFHSSCPLHWTDILSLSCIGRPSFYKFYSEREFSIFCLVLELVVDVLAFHKRALGVWSGGSALEINCEASRTCICVGR